MNRLLTSGRIRVLIGLVFIGVLVGLYVTVLRPHCLSYSDRGLCVLLVRRQKAPKRAEQAKQAKQEAAPTPTPRPIPHGKQTFSVTSGKKTGPQLNGGAIDPYDPLFGAPQKITVKITGKKPVTSVTLTVKTDNQTRNYSMELFEGTATDGTWIGSVQTDDTYLYTYNILFTATDGTETNTVELTLR